MAKKKENRYVALYERLSHDDEQQGESNSISNQKRILEDYALSHGMTVFGISPMMGSPAPGLTALAFRP